MNSQPDKNLIIIVADSPIFNPSEAKAYQNLSVSYSIFLNTLLLSNWIELLSDFNEKFELVTYIHQKDEKHLPKYFFPIDTKKYFYSGEHSLQFSDFLTKNSTETTSKILILYFNSIGTTKENISRIFNLIHTDEPSIVVGKNVKDKITFLCSQGTQQELLLPMMKSHRKFSEYLGYIAEKDVYVHQMDNCLSIDDFEDIKKLYIELSKKESLSYCSKKMHESFNDLFIEYKELINV